MENNKIHIKLVDGDEVILNSDNPNITNLIEKIVKHKDEIDPDKIEITLEGPKNEFDVEKFEEMIKLTVKQYLEDIQLNKRKLNQIMEKLTGKSGLKER